MFQRHRIHHYSPRHHWNLANVIRKNISHGRPGHGKCTEYGLYFWQKVGTTSISCDVAKKSVQSYDLAAKPEENKSTPNTETSI